MLEPRPESAFQVVIYARVSTDDDRQAGSIPTQIQRCQEYCKLMNWTVIEVCQDDGISGRRLDRPGFTRAIDLIKSRQANLLLATSLDRIARTKEFASFLTNVIQPTGADFATLHERFDTSTAAGRMLLGIMLSVMEFQPDQTAEKTAAARKARARAGYWTSYPPFGTIPGPERGLPVKDPASWPALIKAYEMAASGSSDSAIALELERQGVRTRRGAKLSYSTLRRVLENRFYQGEITVDGEVCRLNHECIVPEQLWLAAQRPRRTKPGRKPEQYPYLLRGLRGGPKIFSSDYEITYPAEQAGRPVPLHARHVKARGKTHHYYTRADTIKTVGGIEARQVDPQTDLLPANISAKLLDGKVVEYIVEMAETDRSRELVSASVQVATDRISELKQERSQLSTLLKSLSQQVLAAEDDLLAVARCGSGPAVRIAEERLLKLEAERDTTQARILGLDDAVSRLGDAEREADVVRNQINVVRELRDGEKWSELTELLDMLIEHVDVRSEGIHVYFRALPVMQSVMSIEGKAAPTGVEPVPPP